MLDERSLNLINADLDDELGPGERAELDALLASSAEARSMHAEMSRMANLMVDLPEQEPPAGLRDRIVEQIRLPAARTRGTTATLSVSGLLTAFRPAQAGLAFAAGLLLTVGYYEVAQRGDTPADLTSMVGTMVAKPSNLTGRQKDSLTISQSGLTGTVTLSEVGEYFVLNFDLESVGTTEIEVGLAAAGLGFGGIAHVSTGSNTLDESYEVSGGALRVRSQGKRAFSVFLPRVTDPLRHEAVKQDGSTRQISIGISTAGAEIFRGELQS